MIVDFVKDVVTKEIFDGGNALSTQSVNELLEIYEQES